MDKTFDRIVSNDDVFYRHQKMEEDDLTDVEKREILKNLADSNLSVFLSRYGKFMIADDCDIEHFSKSEDALVQSMLKQIREKKQPTEKQKKNSRFVAMQKLQSDGVYFSDLKMREREPYLFDTMIGRFLDESQRQELRPTVTRKQGESTWSEMLDKFAESGEIADRRNVQQMEWDKSVPKLRSNDHGHDHNSRFVAHVSNQMINTVDEDFVPEEDEIEEEKDEMEKLREELERMARTEADLYDELGDDDTPQMLRQEFESYMQQRFLAGKDKEFFNYSKCDNCDESNTSYIDPIKDRDDEEHWFDED